MVDHNALHRDMLEHSWRYFALHAEQRMSLFNFFLILSGIVSAGLAASLQRHDEFLLLGAALGVLLAMVSFIFWKLDQRVSFLIKHAEDAMADIEKSFPNTSAMLVSNEPPRTTAAKLSGRTFKRIWTYGRAFRVAFWTMGIVGAAGAAVSLLLFFWGPKILGCLEF